MVVIDMGTFTKPLRDTPEGYESRCIVADAQRAAMMQETVAKSCFWNRDTPQYDLWVRTYEKAKAQHG